MSWLGFAIVCAIFSGARDFAAKHSAGKIPSHLIAFLQYAIGAPILVVAASIEGVPDIGPGFITSLLGATVLLTFGSLCFFHSISLSPVSLMAPLRTLTLPSLLLLAPITLNERIRPLGALGVLVLSVGLYVLSYQRKTGFAFGAYRKEAGTKYMLLAVLFFSFCALFEKAGVLSSSSVFFFACETVCGCLSIGILLFFRGRLRNVNFASSARHALPVALCFSLMFIAQSLALATGPVTYVIALKRSGVLLTVLLGMVYLKEGLSLQRLLGAVVVVLGAALISING